MLTPNNSPQHGPRAPQMVPYVQQSHTPKQTWTGQLTGGLIDMHQNRYKYFRWTPKTAKVTFMYVIVVPAALMALGYGTQVCILDTHLRDGRLMMG